jgi:hypothetical protein
MAYVTVYRSKPHNQVWHSSIRFPPCRHNNYCLGLILVIKFQNLISLTTQLAKPFKLNLTIGRFLRTVLLTWTPLGGGAHMSAPSLFLISFSSLVGGNKWLGIKIISNWWMCSSMFAYVHPTQHLKNIEDNLHKFLIIFLIIVTTFIYFSLRHLLQKPLCTLYCFYTLPPLEHLQEFS